MKYFIAITIVGIIFSANFGIDNVWAQETEYELLQSLPIPESGCTGNETGTGTDRCVTTPSQYIAGMFMLIIGIAGVLAVIQIVVGGIKYMSTDAFAGKSEAKNTIQNAILGLLLALGAYIILFTIDERLVNFNIELESIPVASTTAGALGEDWPSDGELRLSLGQAGIGINRWNCIVVGQLSCTSVYGLGAGVESLVRQLRTACRNCLIIITGGTEYWLHSAGTQHRPGGSVVDLANSSALRVFLRTNSESRPDTGTGCAPGTERYIWNGATFVFETPARDHWHVCT